MYRSTNLFAREISLRKKFNVSWSELRMYVDDQYEWGDVSTICSFDASSSIKTLSFKCMVFSFREKFWPLESSLVDLNSGPSIIDFRTSRISRPFLCL